MYIRQNVNMVIYRFVTKETHEPQTKKGKKKQPSTHKYMSEYEYICLIQSIQFFVKGFMRLRTFS